MLLEMITELFPQVGANFAGDQKNWDRDLRICHEAHFPKYFEFALRDGTISLLEVITFIRSAQDSKMVASTLEKYIKQEKIAELLERLAIYIDTIPIDNIGTFLTGFLHTSESFPHGKPTLLSLSLIYQVAEMLKELLMRVAEPVRVTVMEVGLADSDGFTLAAILVNIDEKKAGASLTHEPLWSEENVKKMNVLVIEKLRGAANDHRLEKSEHFLRLLNLWRRQNCEDEVVKWVNALVKRDSASALTFTMAAVNVGIISSHRETREYNSLGLRALEQFIDLDLLWSHLSKLDRTKLPDQQKCVLNLFQRGLEKKKNGEPYESVSDSDLNTI